MRPTDNLPPFADAADAPPTSSAAPDSADASDEKLAQRYAAGEIAAFDLLYARYELPVWRYALRIVRVPSMADTLLKDIWFSALRQLASLDALRQPARAADSKAPVVDDTDFGKNQDASGHPDQADWHFKPWLFSLAHGRVVETMRSAKTPIDSQAEHARTDSAAKERNAGRLSIKPPEPSSQAFCEAVGFRQLRSQGEAKTLLAAVEHLPFAQRYAFLMHAEGRLRTGEIAHATAVSFETAINRLRSAREALRLSLSTST
jgi:DNA-directed RNA polymerase specialized sigma24 family protein